MQYYQMTRHHQGRSLLVAAIGHVSQHLSLMINYYNKLYEEHNRTVNI